VNCQCDLEEYYCWEWPNGFVNLANPKWSWEHAFLVLRWPSKFLFMHCGFLPEFAIYYATMHKCDMNYQVSFYCFNGNKFQWTRNFSLFFFWIGSFINGDFSLGFCNILCIMRYERITQGCTVYECMEMIFQKLVRFFHSFFGLLFS